MSALVTEADMTLAQLFVASYAVNKRFAYETLCDRTLAIDVALDGLSPDEQVHVVLFVLFVKMGIQPAAIEVPS